MLARFVVEEERSIFDLNNILHLLLRIMPAEADVLTESIKWCRGALLSMAGNKNASRQKLLLHGINHPSDDFLDWAAARVNGTLGECPSSSSGTN